MTNINLKSLMGIPSYFNHVLQNHRNIIIETSSMKCDYLFIDSNSLIYDVIHELECSSINDTEIYDKVFSKMIELYKSCNPNILMYVAFDGIPPLPKIYQQRSRRYKSSFTKKILDQKKNTWNTNRITPGTDFMNNLDDYITNKIKSYPKIMFNGSKNQGEGEHKICNFIRTHIKQKQSSIMIYGLDADLIMLGLLLVCDDYQIYLHKETRHFTYIKQIDPNETYYFDLCKMGDQLHNIMEQEDNASSIFDYIVICFMCGNDFLPHLPSINIRFDGINTLIDHYKKMNSEKNHPFIDKTNRQIIWSNLREMFSHLKTDETDRIIQNIKTKSKQRRYQHPKDFEEKLNILPCFDMTKDMYLMNNIESYNQFCLGTQKVDQICIDYLKCFEWTWNYYQGNLISNSIVYKHSHGPLFNDLLNYIPAFDSENFIDLQPKNVIEYDMNDEIQSLAQLYFVIPYEEHSKIIPQDLYNETSDRVYQKFPQLKVKTNHIDFDYLLCKYFWESHVIIQDVDIFALDEILQSSSISI